MIVMNCELLYMMVNSVGHIWIWRTCFCVCLSWQIKHMMAFIEQEAKEKVEEIDAKVIEVCQSVSLVICAAVSC